MWVCIFVMQHHEIWCECVHSSNIQLCSFQKFPALVSPSVRICLHVCCAVYFSVTLICLVILCNPFAAMYNKVSFFISAIHVIYWHTCVLEAGPVWTCYGEFTRCVAAMLLVLYEHVIQNIPLQICSQTTHVIRSSRVIYSCPIYMWFAFLLGMFAWLCAPDNNV